MKFQLILHCILFDANISLCLMNYLLIFISWHLGESSELSQDGLARRLPCTLSRQVVGRNTRQWEAVLGDGMRCQVVGSNAGQWEAANS